jgi:hypothetical protein
VRSIYALMSDGQGQDGHHGKVQQQGSRLGAQRSSGEGPTGSGALAMAHTGIGDVLPGLVTRCSR